MKKLRLFITLVISMIALGLSAQVLPQAINFQAIARDASGQPLANANIMLRLTVIDGTPEGTEVYREIRSLQTNAYGGFNFQLGREPNVANGVFADIDWANGRKFLKVDYDPTNTMSFGLSLGTIEFISVPYAFVAGGVSYIDATNASDGDVLVFNAATGRFEPQAISTSGITEETDPTVPAWAKEDEKPIYDYLEILNTPEIPEVPENVSAFNNDAGYITSADIPAIPEVPENVSAFNNDAGYITYADVSEIPENVSAFNNDAGYITFADIPAIPEVPENVSAFNNDAGYITSADVPEIPENVSAFNNDAGYITSANIPQIPEIPENVSAFTNDMGYLTQEVQGLPNVTAINNSAYTQIKNVIDPTESQDAATKAYVDALEATVNALAANINSLTATLDSVINVINGGGTPVVTLPTVLTNEVSYVGETTATCGGIVISDGGATVTSYGVCWSTTPNPTVGNSHTTDGTGTGAFSSSIAGLTAVTTYYVRAYATNSVGTAYGEQKTFTTITTNTLTIITAEVSDVTTTTATCGGNVTNDGGSIVIARGVCWSVTPTPTIADSKTTDGYNTGVFTSAITGLASGTTYYVRAYATNGSGTAYGEEKTFTTLSEALPTVVTAEVSDITAFSAICGGTVTLNSSITVTGRGICWSTSPNPTTADSKTTNGSGAGTFTSSITELTAATLYYVRAYAEYTGGGTVYGETKIFMTNPTLPTVITNEITDVTGSTAVCGGNVTYDGGASVTARGVCWSTGSYPTISDSHTTDGSGAGSFISSITGLAPNTIYYLRAYATNSLGTSYGEIKRINFPATPTGAVKYGLFSVSNTTRVFFSKGNLQYRASTNAWMFASKQWDYIGNNNASISSTYSGLIDLFAWGSGNNPTNSTSTSNTSFVDWGSKINNSGANQWRTLTKDEWDYMLFTRTTSSGIRYAKATVNGKAGVIILPDDWSNFYHILNETNNVDVDFSVNTITSADWTNNLEAYGAVFLPAAGQRSGTTVSDVGVKGLYWSSTPDTSPSTNLYSYKLIFYDSAHFINRQLRSSGLSVRLVQDL